MRLDDLCPHNESLPQSLRSAESNTAAERCQQHKGHAARGYGTLAKSGSRLSTLAITASTWFGDPMSATCSRVSSRKTSLTVASDCARFRSLLPARIACGLFDA